MKNFNFDYIKGNILEKGMRELKRPLAFLLSICMIVTMVAVPYPERVFADSYPGGDYTLAGDVSWGDTNIGAGATLTIPAGKTLEVNGILTLPANVTVTGNGTIKLEGVGSYIKITGDNVTLEDVTITSETPGRTKSLIIDDINTNGTAVYITLDSVTLEGAHMASSSPLPAAFLFNWVTDDYMHYLRLKGNTVIKDNVGGTSCVIAAPGSTSSTQNKVYVEGDVQIVDNYLADGVTNANIKSYNSSYIEVSDDLTEDANIGVTPANAADVATLGAGVTDTNEAKDLARDAFFIDDFHNYGVTRSADRLVPTAKSDMVVAVEGAGEVRAEDARGRNIISASGSTTVTVSEVAGKEVTMYMDPDSSDYFVKAVTVGAVNKTPDLAAYTGSITTAYKKSITFDAISGAGHVVFEEAISSVEIDGIIEPYGYLEAGDSLQGKALGACNPVSATITITSAVWKHGSTVMGDEDEFVTGEDYTLDLVLTATGGSKFAPGATAGAAGESAAGTFTDETVLNVSIPYTAAPMPLSVAIGCGYVTFSAIASNALFDDNYHGPVITMRDYKSGNLDVQNSAINGYSTNVSFGTVTSAQGGSVPNTYIEYTIPVNGPRMAGTYSNINISIANTNYEGAWDTGDLSYTIAKKTITPTAIDISGSDKVYDGTTAVTAGGITFDGLVNNATGLTKGTHYTATFAFDSPNAGSRSVIASGITLAGAADTNYQLGVDTFTQAGARIAKTTPVPRSNSFSYIPVASTTNKTIGEISFALADAAAADSAKWFANVNNLSLNVKGALTLVKNDGSFAALPGDTVISKNTEYRWFFEPTDTTNYTTNTGLYVLWPVEPIKAVTVSGIAAPVAGNTLAAPAVVIDNVGPTAGSEVTCENVVWKETNPNNSATTTITTGAVFKPHRTYTMELTLKAGAEDRFATTQDVAVDLVVGGTPYHMTKSEGSTGALGGTITYTCTFDTPKGTLTSSMFTAPTETNVTYSGVLYYCTLPAIVDPAVNDGELLYKSKSDGAWPNNWTNFSNTSALAGYRTAGTGQTFNIKVSHPDYSNELSFTYDINIAKKPINAVTIETVPQRPYNATAVIDPSTLTFASSDIIGTDDVAFTATSAIISDANYNTGVVTVTASGISISGNDAGNYALNSTTAAKTGALNVIQKVTPTGGSITFNEVTGAGTDYSQLNVQPQGFINEYITSGPNGVAGDIVPYTNISFETEVSVVNLNTTIIKRQEYGWKFVPSGAAAVNYNIVTGAATFWPGAPITHVTFGGIALPAPNTIPTVKDDITAIYSDSTASIPVEAIAWYETSDITGVADRTLTGTEKFYYNRFHTLVITLSAIGTDDEFNYNKPFQGPDFGGVVEIGGTPYSCTTEIINTGTAQAPEYKRAVLTCHFTDPVTGQDEKTAKGTLTMANLEYRDFASFTSAGGVLTMYGNGGLRGEGDYNIAYVFTGRWVGPTPTCSALQSPELTEFTYSVEGGEFTTTAPRYRNVMDSKAITIRMTHPDYTSVNNIEKEVNLQIAPCKVHPIGINYAGKEYDGTTDIVGATIKWMPVGAGAQAGSSTAYEESTSAEIANNIEYSAVYEFDGPSAGTAKTVNVTNISWVASGNFTIAVSAYPADPNFEYDPSEPNAFTYNNCAPIWKAKSKPFNGTILTKSIGSAVSLSAITADYILETQDDSTSSAATRMVNRNNTARNVYGTLGFDNAAGTGFMTADELDAVKIVQGQAYTWRFEPATGYAGNYAITTGSQILWPVPQNPGGGGGGGGGGGAVVVTPTSSAIKDGIVVENKTKDDERIHVYKGVNGKIVMDEDYRVNNNGEAVTKALAKTPDANVAVSTNGDVVVKAIVESGALKAYMRGEYYLTLEKRGTDYVDMDRHWSKKYVDFCSNRNLVNGVGEGKFDPDGTLTRGMAATIFYRLESSPSITSSARWFADVERGEWYSNGIAWAGGCGVVNGIGIKNFAPHWAITREQMAVMIYNYCVKFCGVGDVANASSVRTRYYDGTSISDWAEKAVAFCYTAGLMTGDEDGNFCPQLSATRAEFSTIMERLIRAIVENTL